MLINVNRLAASPSCPIGCSRHRCWWEHENSSGTTSPSLSMATCESVVGTQAPTLPPPSFLLLLLLFTNTRSEPISCIPAFWRQYRLGYRESHNSRAGMKSIMFSKWIIILCAALHPPPLLITASLVARCLHAVTSQRQAIPTRCWTLCDLPWPCSMTAEKNVGGKMKKQRQAYQNWFSSPTLFDLKGSWLIRWKFYFWLNSVLNCR